MGEQPPAAGGTRKRPPEGGRLLSLKRTSRRKYVSARGGFVVVGRRTFSRNATTPGYVPFYRLRAFHTPR